MKIVKNGRLFGKLNIVDVLILLVVIAAVAFLAVRMVEAAAKRSLPTSRVRRRTCATPSCARTCP